MVEQGKIKAGDFLTTAEGTVRPHVETIRNLRSPGQLVVVLTDGVPSILISARRNRANQYTFFITREKGIPVFGKRQLSDPNKELQPPPEDSPERFDTAFVGVRKNAPDIFINTTTKLSLLNETHKGNESSVTFTLATTQPVDILVINNPLSGEGLTGKMGRFLEELEARVLAGEHKPK